MENKPNEIPVQKAKYQDVQVGVQRASLIKAHADGSEEKTIFKALSDDELQLLDKEFSETASQIDAHDKILDAAKAVHKANTVELKQNYGYILGKISAKGETKVMDVHKFFNHSEMTVEYYDNDGIFVESRAMMPSEKNAIFGSIKTEAVVRNIAVNE